MSKRMTIVFDDEDLYNELKQEAARRGRSSKDIVAEAVQEWLEAREDEDLQADLAQARTEWQQLGGVEAGEFFLQLESNRND